MLSNVLKTTLVIVVQVLLSTSLRAQSSGGLWTPAAAPANHDTDRSASAQPARWFVLDAAQLATRLAAAPPETRPADAVPVELPYPDGTLHRFALTQVPVMAPALAARYPQIQTYAARALDEPGTTARLEWTPAGLHAQVLTPTGPLSVTAEPGAPGQYASRLDGPSGFGCNALPVPGNGKGNGLAQRSAAAPPAPYGTQLRTLRLALAATGEYAQNLGGGTTAGTLASMVTMVSAVNAVYERELSLRLQLVVNTDQLIYLDAATDPYNNANPLDLANANEAVVDALPGGTGAYDLAHVLGYFANGYSGVAYVGVVCTPGWAAKGASTGSTATLMAEVVTHEMGHQLGSSHTFNGNQRTCAGNRTAALAYEPGAGNTIMSYDSRCAPDNVGAGIRYFHAGSLGVILPELTCGTLTSTGNQPPVLTAPAGPYTIPLGTPFALAGSGTDPNGDALTYSWEQMNLGNPSGLAGAATDASAPPLFRSLAPALSPVRTFPALPALLSNSASLGEILPMVARPLNFRLTARDSRGGVAATDVALTVAAAGPFRVTAPAAPVTAAPGSILALTWDVLGTNQSPVSCANVQVLFSTDGGLTFPTVLLASTPNSGSAQVALPRVNTTQGRLKIQALGNVFFALNNTNLTLAGPLPVELTAFTAEVRGRAAHLAWGTASEKNNRGFAVEASADGSTFRRIGWVAGAGSSSAPRQYQYDDNTLAATSGPTAYYRLRQLDTDGTESFSPVRAVAVPAGPALSLQLWPNPAREAVTVAGPAPGQPVQLLDLTGRVLQMAPMPASGPLQLALSGLAPGVYVVRAAGQSRRLEIN